MTLMDQQAVIAILREHESDLRARGVRRAALFGSLARGVARADSDIDIFVDLEPAAISDIYAYVGLKTYITALFDGPVDVVDWQALKPHIRPPADGDAIYAF